MCVIKTRKTEYDASYLFIYTVRPQALRQTQHTNKRKRRRRRKGKKRKKLIENFKVLMMMMMM
jgi:hypothetical protein